MDAVRWRRFEYLLSERGVRSNAGIGECGDGDRRGLRATRATKAGDTLVSVPSRLLLDARHADASTVGKLWARPGEASPAPIAKLALLLVYEWRGGSEASLA
eukprot:5649517-Prymnesium_polylepis.1